MKTFVFLFAAVILFVVAILFAVAAEPWRSFGASALSPNIMAGLASLGFAIAGGMGLIAAALVSKRD